jgi:hypothetical protein
LLSIALLVDSDSALLYTHIYSTRGNPTRIPCIVWGIVQWHCFVAATTVLHRRNIMAVVTSKTLTIQIPKAVYDWLERESQTSDQPVEELASVLIEEAMRVEQFPGIFFRSGPSGRRAVLLGGMDVWELIMLYQVHGREGLLSEFNVHEHQIDAALAYYAEFSAEIDANIWENNRPVEYWMAKYPDQKIHVHEW